MPVFQGSRPSPMRANSSIYTFMRTASCEYRCNYFRLKLKYRVVSNKEKQMVSFEKVLWFL